MQVKKARSNELRAEKRNFSKSSQPLKPVNKKVGRIIFGSLLLLVGVYSTVAKGPDLVDYVNRPVSKIRVENQWQQITEAQVSGILSKFMGIGFFNLDTQGVKAELETLSWVRFASVKRIWPDTIALDIREEKAIARWGEGAYLNQSGEVFRPTTEAKNLTLPMLSGPEDTQTQVMQQYLSLSQLLLPEDLRLSSLTLSPRGSWELTLNESIHVSAGRFDAFANLSRLVDILNRHGSINLNEIASIDLRYKNGFAVKKVKYEMAEVAAR
jgi:cell division protein FtsQ